MSWMNVFCWCLYCVASTYLVIKGCTVPVKVFFRSADAECGNLTLMINTAGWKRNANQWHSSLQTRNDFVLVLSLCRVWTHSNSSSRGHLPYQEKNILLTNAHNAVWRFTVLLKSHDVFEAAISLFAGSDGRKTTYGDTHWVLLLGSCFFYQSQVPHILCEPNATSKGLI